ncbi:hypothetical protein [Roseivirga misakiensis]|uniref:Uncharacterized protein n=1 Tax=Roseivirga misakiensis TaxID=1563681 RepID=A0A1E5T325_9BACT|nr:hypothetical protein [Roseivirga misakiensis]OEK05788.1 hypothetical protein BFP71_06625 [Roseivirga misakiensis]
MKNSICLLSLICFLLLSGCGLDSDNDEAIVYLEDRIDDRLKYLKSNFRHSLLNYDNMSIPYWEVDSAFSALSNSQDLEFINRQLVDITSRLDVTPLKVKKNNDFQLFILLNKLLVLDKLVSDAQVSTTFNSLRAKAFIVKETESDVEFNIAITAFDELFNPSIEMITKTDTIQIDVNDQGYGYFKITKNKNFKDLSLRGDVIIYSKKGEKVRLPFSIGPN